VLAGPWVAVQWETQNQGFEFGVAEPPAAGTDGVSPGYPVFGTDGVVVFSGSKVKEIAGDVLSYVTSLDGQKAWGDVVGVGNPPILEEARAAIKDSASPIGRRCLEIAEKMVANPAPEIRNGEIALVEREQKPVTPGFGEVIQAAFVGKVSDLRKELRALEARSNKSLDDAIAAASKKGAKASREDWVFSNWDPSKDFTREDYDAT
jgi:multiple sugar transport system substrate-binding protein